MYRFCCVRHACDRIYVGAGGLTVWVWRPSRFVHRATGRWRVPHKPYCPPRRSRVVARPLVSPVDTPPLSVFIFVLTIVVPPPVAGRPKFGSSPKVGILQGLYSVAGPDLKTEHPVNNLTGCRQHKVKGAITEDLG